MLIPLTRERLNMLAMGGCVVPNCRHDHSVLYLHGACHPKARLNVRYDSGTVICECAICREMIAVIAVANDYGKDHGIHPTCHPKTQLFVRYERPTGLLICDCATCKKKFMTIPVASSGPFPHVH
jgi:hypothetical protein